MDRRTFIGNFGGGLLALPLTARAQKSATPVIGFLSGATRAQWTANVAGFRQGLNEAGYEGEGTSGSNFAGRRVTMNDFPPSQPTLFAVESPS